MAERPPAGMSRRAFLGMAAAAATTGCRFGREAVPYTRRPPEVVPGVATYYASTCPGGLRPCAVLVKTREGRPVHVEGNDEHPATGGRASLHAIAGIQELYGPDRACAPQRGGRAATWPRVLGELGAALRAARDAGKPVLLLTSASASPSRSQVLAELAAVLPGLDRLAWEPGQAEGPQAGAEAAFGQPVRVRPLLAEARCILALGADVLDDPAAARGFGAGRRPPVMNRLWALEGPMSLTGSNADHRFPVRPSRLAALAFALARDLGGRPGYALPAGVSLPDLPGVPGDDLPAWAWKALVDDLAAAGPRAAVLAGAGLPAEAHLAAHLLNAMLGSRAVAVEPAPALASLADLDRAVAAMAAGHYGAVLVWGVNPAYAYPDAAAWRAAFARVPVQAWIGAQADETAAQARLVLPEPHWLEAWGDHLDGPWLTLQQPAVAPLYDTRPGEDVLLELARALGREVPGDFLDLLRARWRREVLPGFGPVPFDRFFQAALHDGVVTLPAPAAPRFRGGAVAEAARRALAAPAPGLDLVLRPGYAVGDGRHAGSAWLQELPDPVTKVTWANPLTLAPEDAEAAGLGDGDLVWLDLAGTRRLFPVLAQPGQTRGTLGAALGYGRRAGSGRGIGENAFPFLGGPAPLLRTGARLDKARGRISLPSTRGHHDLKEEVPARALDLAGLARLHRDAPHLPTLYPGLPGDAHRWGMAIDLSACLGCSACMVACQSENNVPTVGPEQVNRGREMHWLRIDAYWTAAGPVHQPMLCQHCEHAPCETVCPVNATNHSPDGLNQMVYNRCVGVRYCANNCPYKVRRFNFLEYNGGKAEPELLAFNPDVTVRPRGVMEKCTFCVQRIQDGRQRAQGERRPLKDGDIVPACAAACPTDALVFGDLNDPASGAARLAQDRRGYHVLEELGTRPVVTYLAKLRNPHPEAPR